MSEYQCPYSNEELQGFWVYRGQVVEVIEDAGGNCVKVRWLDGSEKWVNRDELKMEEK